MMKAKKQPKRADESQFSVRGVIFPHDAKEMGNDLTGCLA